MLRTYWACRLTWTQVVVSFWFKWVLQHFLEQDVDRRGPEMNETWSLPSSGWPYKGGVHTPAQGCWYSLTVVHKLAPRKGPRETKEIDHFRLVGASFNKQGWSLNMLTILVLGGHKIHTALHRPTRIKVYGEDLTGFSHIFNPDGLNNTLLSSRLCPWNSSHCGNIG